MDPEPDEEERGEEVTLFQQVAEPLVYLLALAITFGSGALAYRQRLTAYHIVRTFVLGVYVLISLMVTLDLYRLTLGTLDLIPALATTGISLGLAQAVFLLAGAQGIYFSPSVTYRGFLPELAKRKWHAALFGVFVALAAISAAASAVFSPGPPGYITDFAGNLVPSMLVSPSLVELIIVLYAYFLAYPTTLMILGSSKVEDRRLRRSLAGLALGWGLVSGFYVVAEVGAWVYKFDGTGLMYLANAVVFYLVIRYFRRSASLAGFVEQKAPAAGRGAPRQGAVSPLAGSLVGKKLLYEVDPSLPYEQNLKRALEELASSEQAVFVFTAKASPLHSALAGGAGLRFFLTTPGVSYVKVSDETSEVLVPQNDFALLLDVVDKTLGSSKGDVVFVFDSVSELLLNAGIEKTYKFLKQFLELLHEPRATGLFLFIKGAHGARDVNLLKGIFPNHFLEDRGGARLVK